jgi:hypothetical protein
MVLGFDFDRRLPIVGLRLLFGFLGGNSLVVLPFRFQRASFPARKLDL